MLQTLTNLQNSIDLHTIIGIVFLVLILIPIMILFIALYQNLLDTVRPRQGNRPSKAPRTRPNAAMETRALRLKQNPVQNSMRVRANIGPYGSKSKDLMTSDLRAVK